MIKNPQVFISKSFDDLRVQDMLFLHEAAKTGRVVVFLWSDELVQQQTGRMPVFTLEERKYLLQATRFVDRIEILDRLPERSGIPSFSGADSIWFVMPGDDDPQKRRFCLEQGIQYKVHVSPNRLPLFSYVPLVPETLNKKVLVTGSFDWLHSGHVRFFEECAALGDLYVIVGHDDNIRLLKGERHPMFPQRERLFMVQSIRFVRRAVISTGHGWMDAAPEIELIQPDLYVVNQDGDVEQKRLFCQEKGIEYIVLRRLPKPGLPPRQSRQLRRILGKQDGVKD